MSSFDGSLINLSLHASFSHSAESYLNQICISKDFENGMFCKTMTTNKLILL